MNAKDLLREKQDWDFFKDEVQEEIESEKDSLYKNDEFIDAYEVESLIDDAYSLSEEVANLLESFSYENPEDLATAYKKIIELAELLHY